MKTHFLNLLLCLIAFFCVGQNENDSTHQKSNPIIYADFLVGGANSANGEVKGLTFGFTLNYQIKKDLLTFRSTYINEVNKNPGLSALLVLPIFIGGDSMNEFALMYGKRFIFKSSALSVSAGASTNLLKFTQVINNESQQFRESYFAVPFEVNFHLFKGEKRRFKMLYGLIPIGNPTAFGRNVGIKFFGSFGRNNYLGLGLNFGLGWHKKY